jgi:hypothetical protein
MNRCPHLPVPRSSAWRFGLIAALLGLSLTAGAQQNVRPFPANALRGTLQVTNPPDLLLDGRYARLSPGARIRGENNLLVMSGSLVGRSLVVNYVRDAQGMVHEVWLLNTTEAQQKMSGAPARSNYVSDYAPAPADGAPAAPVTSTPQQ